MDFAPTGASVNFFSHGFSWRHYFWMLQKRFSCSVCLDTVGTSQFTVMNEFKFSCPHCSQHLQCDELHSGRQIQCPGCNHLITIPSAPGKTADFKPQSGATWNTFVPPGDAKKKS